MAETARDFAVPEAKEFGVGDQRHVQAQRVYLILTAHVMKKWKWREEPRPPSRRKDVLITYGELAKRMGMDPKAGITLGIPLGIVGEYCRVNGLPTLNSIVIKQETGAPGDHVLVRDGKTYRDEQREVMKTDWFAYRVPTAGAFRKIREYQRRQAAVRLVRP